MLETNKVRTSRDGDQFHYLWASRRALLLLSPETQLKQITIEGVSNREFGDKQISEGEYVVDVAEYYGGDSFETASKIKYYQLKHSTVATEQPFLPSKLKNTIKGFSERYKRLIEVVGKEAAQEKLEFIFISNRPINEEFHQSINQIALGNLTSKKNRDKLEDYTKLKDEELTNFCKLLIFDTNAEGYWEQRNILAFETTRYLPGSDTHAPINLKELITRKALSESQDNPSIDRIDVLKALNTDLDALFPVKNRIKKIDVPIYRACEQQIIEQILSEPSSTFIIQAEGGVGKTVFASHINEYLPESSISVVYDCFGDGDYRNITTSRHTHRVALVQIANELASKGLCHPLIPNSSAMVSDYTKAFLSRIRQAAEKISYLNSSAVLSIVIDAADNAQMAAQELGEIRSFIIDLLKENLPENVKLIAFCRPYRLKLLDAPATVKNLLLRSFTIDETRQHLSQYYSQLSDEDVAEFHRLTSQNPRIQNMALERKLMLSETLRLFGSNPTSVEDTINALLEAAIVKIKEENYVENHKIEKLCESIAILRPLVPIEVLASLSQVPIEQIRSFISDIGGHPIRLLDDYIQFIDEPTETWFRCRFKPTNIQQIKAYTDTLKPLAKHSPYVASVLPQLMLESEEYEELFNAILNSSLLPETSLLEKRHIELQRLQFAIKAGIKIDRLIDVAKLSLKAGGESAAQTRQNKLIADNLDLAAAFFEDGKIQELIANDIFKLEDKWTGAKFAYEAQLMSYKKNLVSEARVKLRNAEDWLLNWFKQPESERRHREIEDSDIARLFIAHFNIHGAERSINEINRWKPKAIAYSVGVQVTKEFLLYNRFSDLEAMLEHVGNNIYFTLGVVTGAFENGFEISKKYLIRSFKIISYRSVIIDLNKSTHHLELKTIINYLMACFNSGVCDSATASEILSRYMPIKLPYHLIDTYSHSSKSVYLTAYALLAKWSNNELTVENIINENNKSEIQNSKSSTEAEEIIKNISTLIPWYTLLVDSLLANTTLGNIEALIDNAKKSSFVPRPDSYNFNSMKVDDIVQAWFTIIIANDHEKEQLLKELFEYINSRNIRLLPTTLNKFIKICCQHSELTDMAYELSQQNFDRALQAEVNANEILNDVVEVTRAIFLLDKKQAKSYFDQAIRVSSKIGEENFSRWEALTYHALHLKDFTYDNHSELAYRFARCAELTYKYMYEGHFNWDQSVKALVDIHPASSLAIASRWRDRNFGEDDVVINAIGEKLLERELVSPLTVLSLLCLKSGYDVKSIVNKVQFNTLDEQTQKAMILIIYRYQVIPNPSKSNRAFLKDLCDHCTVEITEVSRFLETYILDDIKEEHPNHVSQSKIEDVDWDFIFIDKQLDSNYDFESARARYLNLDGYHSDIVYYDELHNRLSNTYIYDYINSILEDPKTDSYKLRLILESIPDRWKNRQAVRECFGENLELFCRRHALDLYISLRYNDPKLIELMSSVSGLPESKFIQKILLGRSDSAELLDSDQLFNMVAMISMLITSEASKEVLEYGLTLLEEDLTDDTADGEWGLNLTPPDTIEEAYAGYLVSGLASPSLYTRWLNTHAVKALGELKQTSMLEALVNFTQTQSIEAFADTRFVYYSYTALQWLLIALLKISFEIVEILVPYVDFFKSNINPEQPHILIRLYSAKILLNLEEQGLIDLSPTDVDIYKSIGVSKFNFIERENVNLDEYDNLDESNIDSFGIDFGPYWLEPLGRHFGMYGNHINYETSLVKRNFFKNIDRDGYSDDNRYKNSIYEWQATNHSHGSAPSVEDLNFYTNYHSMMIIADLLLRKKPLVSEDWDTFSKWLSEYDFSVLNNAWLSEFRDSMPKRTSNWQIDTDQRNPNWEYSTSPSDFDEHLNFNNDWLPIWGAWTEVFDSRKSKNFYMRSSLVTPQTSLALFHSLKTYQNPHDYCLPKLDDSFNIDNGAFKLKPWISESEWCETAIFDKDPWSASIDYKNLKPSDEIIQLMGLRADAVDKVWFDRENNEVIRTQYWGELNSPNQEHSRGSNMLISKHFLIGLLQVLDMNLIISFSGRHYMNSRYGKDQDYHDEFGYIPNSEKIYLITKDGTFHEY